MKKKMYQVHIELKNSKPKIWRRIIVKPNVLLKDLHGIIQTTMGWNNYHLHQFHDGVNYFAPAKFDIEDAINYSKIKLNDFLTKEKDYINYEYDFGDGWEHKITLEKIIEDDSKNQVPRCIKGKGACPPEDCGGVWGYEHLLEVLRDPKHEEYEDIKVWVGEHFDPDYFGLEEINFGLEEPDFGCYAFE